MSDSQLDRRAAHATRRNDAALEAHDLVKAYPAANHQLVEVLRGVSLRVVRGEMVAVTGVSGAGKSTLLHLLGGLERADRGRITLDDFSITAASEQALTAWRNQRVGFVFQFHRLLGDLTAMENVALPLMIGRRARRECTYRAAEMLEAVDLSTLGARRVTELSGGEQQRVAIARALVTRPQLVLADEPTGNLDADAALRCGDLLARLCRAHHAATIIATHNHALAAMCDRALILEGGRIREAR